MHSLYTARAFPFYIISVYFQVVMRKKETSKLLPKAIFPFALLKSRGIEMDISTARH
jgi:hypothetical protein